MVMKMYAPNARRRRRRRRVLSPHQPPPQINLSALLSDPGVQYQLDKQREISRHTSRDVEYDPTLTAAPEEYDPEFPFY